MFDLGWQELFIIGTVTLIVVGPKDLPKLLNKVGKGFGKIKQISRERSDGVKVLNVESNKGVKIDD